LNRIERLLSNPRVTASRDGAPEADGACIVYWMQRAQRGVDNPALDAAIAAANDLQRTIAVFFGLHPKYPNTNPRHYAFLVEGLEETKRRLKSVVRRFLLMNPPSHHQNCGCSTVCLYNKTVGIYLICTTADHWLNRWGIQMEKSGVIGQAKRRYLRHCDRLD
jgi:hypothetical protein